MRVIVAGSRSIVDYLIVEQAIKDSGFTITELISGCAKGVDTLGEYYAQLRDIPIKKFPADWQRHGRKAGYIRNMEMAKHADALIAVWDGQSSGTVHMINVAKERGLKMYTHFVYLL